MAVNGIYMAFRVRGGVLPYVRAYGDCVLNDLLPGFRDLEQRAQEVADTEFERLGSEPAGEDCDGDMSVAAETAQEQGQAFYETMSGLRQATLNLFAAGLFHLIEQQLADLCWDGAFRVPEPGDTKLSVVAKWYLRHFGIDLTRLKNWATIDELRLVANTVKHTEGGSAEALRARRPSIFQHPDLADFRQIPSAIAARPIRLPLAGDDLYVTEAMIREYAAGATEFFEAIAAYFEQNAKEDYPRGG